MINGSEPVYSSFRFDALGTQWEIATGQPLDGAVRQLILKRVNDFERTYSRFRDDSLVARVAAASEGGRFLFPEDSTVLFDLYDRLYEATGGAVDPLVGRRLELLGYDGTYSLTPAPAAVREAEALARRKWSSDVIREGTTVITHAPLVIDVGAAGKGYLVDLVSEVLRTAGVADYLIDGSGDLRHSGQPPVRVGLEHPFDPTLVIGVSNLRDAALCASAVNRRAWADGLHHVLDARTGHSVQHVVATWVVADDAATADGLATALFVTAPERLAETFTFAYVRMFADGRAEVAPGRYQILAAINAVHTSARDMRDTDWSQVLALYDQLVRLDPSPIIALNRAIAVAELDGPEVALAAVDRLEHRLAGYHAYHATRADLLRRLGRSQQSRAAYDKAIELAGNTAETAYLTRRRDELR
jgi:FAD:protein FMN transferase